MATAPSSMETAELMFVCFKRIRRLVDAELGLCGLSLSRARMLSELSKRGPLQQGALAAVFDLAPRTVTELVDTLERDGLVERRTDPADRRARQVHLTPAGVEAQARGARIRQQIVDRVLGNLTDEQRLGLSTALRLMELEIDKIDADSGSVGSVADGICAP